MPYTQPGYMQMVETISLNSTRDVVSVDFHFRAITKRDACKMLHTTILGDPVMVSIPSRWRRNSGPAGQGDCIILVIKLMMLSQNGHNRGQGQEIC